MKGKKIKMTATVRLLSGKYEKDSHPFLTKKEKDFCLNKGFAEELDAETKEAKEPKKAKQK